MATRNRTPHKWYLGCSKCGQKDPAEFYGTSAWCKRCHKNAVYEQRLRSYGLTLEDQARILEKQGHKCAVCRNPPTGERSLHFDHCHTSGKSRAFLCRRCNQVLGYVHDSPRILRLLAGYLEQHAVT